VQDLFGQAQAFFAAQNWSETVNTLVSLRKADKTYQTAAADGMFYVALRMRGVDKILNQRDLEGGIYDLALAERFGPLDAEAENTRTLARLYLYGNSFWEAYPEQAVYYFQQVAAMAPYLTDASGWTARERYRAALMQLGALLVKKEDPCAAVAQYELALQIRADEALQKAYADAAEACNPPTATVLPSETPTVTPTPTITLEPSVTVAPPTAEPPTAEPPTAGPPTAEPPTAQPPTGEPPTAAPPTAEPPTQAPPTAEPTTQPPPDQPSPTP
jgi:hypothetical protein